MVLKIGTRVEVGLQNGRRRKVVSYFLRRRPFLSLQTFLSMQNNLNFTYIFEPLPKGAYYNNYTDFVEPIKANPFLRTMRDSDGKTLLHWSIYNGYSLLTRFLIENVSDFFSLQDKNGRTAWHLATALADANTVPRLLTAIKDTHPAVLIQGDSKGAAALHLALMSNFAKKPMNREKGIFPFLTPPDVMDYEGSDHIRSKHGGYILNLLSSEPTLMNTPDAVGETPSAILSWCSEMRELMRDRSLINADASSLHLAVLRKDEEGALRLLRYFPGFSGQFV